MMHLSTRSALVAVLGLTGSFALAQGTPAQNPPANQNKKYEDTIKGAETQSGLFKVHKIEDKVLWELSPSTLGKEMMWSVEVAKLPQDAAGYPGSAMGTKVVRFERRKSQIFMREVRYGMRTTDGGGLGTGVDYNSVEPIIQNFSVECDSPDGGAVIDVTNFFVSDPTFMGVRSMFGGGSPDSRRSWIERTKAFPRNVETRSVLTFVGGGAPSGGGVGRRGGAIGGTATATVHYSLVMLPEKPMMPRYKDSRIGFFTEGFRVFAPDKPVKAKEYIARFRLEKKDPSAALSDPVHPIVFYLSREVPERWRPALKRGVESWQKAFEAAGFSHAIICKDAPSVAEDATWDPEDVRYSVIRWAPSETANAMGPHTSDPRTGETLSAHVIFWHNIIDLSSKWYFSQCAAIDARCKSIPLPDDLQESLMEYVCAHEIGHTLGLEHNFRASSSRTIAELRNPAFMANHGVSSSIMSYSRNNYVAQPGDGIVYSNNRFLGEYDLFAIQYGYTPIAGAHSPDDEIPWLDRHLSRQVNDRTVRFGNYKYRIDPTTMSENISDDPTEATRLGLLNLDRIARNTLLPATTRFGEDYTVLSEYWDELNQHRMMWLMHVVRQIGGVVETDYHSGRGGDVFRPVSAAKQAAAVKFLTTTGMETPEGLLNPAILRRISPDGHLATTEMVQSLVLGQLLSEARIKRLFEEEVTYGGEAYKVSQLVSDLQSGVWSEVGASRPSIKATRRALQRMYLDTVDQRLNGAGKTATELGQLERTALRGLAKQLDRAIPAAADTLTCDHLKECRKSIERIIDGKSPAAGAASGGGAAGFFGINPEDLDGIEFGCFSREGRLLEFLRGIED